jgi:hypothetical protein
VAGRASNQSLEEGLHKQAATEPSRCPAAFRPAAGSQQVLHREKLFGLQPIAARDRFEKVNASNVTCSCRIAGSSRHVLTEAGGIGQREPWPQGPTGRYKS